MTTQSSWQQQIEKNLLQLQKTITALKPTQKITLVAVTKTHPPQLLYICKNLCLQHVAENRPQEMTAKFSHDTELHNAFQKHFIGNLQKNKIKYLANLVNSIDSIADLTTLESIEEQFAKREASRIEILLQINSTQEEHKGGISFQDIDSLKRLIDFCQHSQFLHAAGLMTMGPTPDPQKNFKVGQEEHRQATRIAFARTASLFASLRTFVGEDFTRLSMGMSHDYDIAIQEGATEIRIGSLLFGARPQK